MQNLLKIPDFHEGNSPKFPLALGKFFGNFPRAFGPREISKNLPRARQNFGAKSLKNQEFLLKIHDIILKIPFGSYSC